MPSRSSRAGASASHHVSSSSTSSRYAVPKLVSIDLALTSQAYETIFRAGQTIALDRQAQTGARERRRGREDDEEDDSMMVEGSGGV